MPKISNAFRTPVAGVMTVLTLASLGLTACGGSSGSTSSQANAAATSTAGVSTSTAGSTTTGPAKTGSPRTGTSTTGSSQQGTGTQRARSGQFAGLRECLQKNGITLPKPIPGAGLGGLRIPKGVTPARYQAALRKCSGFFGGGTGVRPTASPVFRQALAKYAACLRQNGVNIPAPNTSGNGPVLGTKGLNTSSPQFRTATMKCRAVLAAAFRAPGSGAAAGTGGRVGGG
jgi:hypothetical protein